MMKLKVLLTTLFLLAAAPTHAVERQLTADVINGIAADKNFMKANSNFESGSVGNWTSYADAAAATPVDGTGGSPTVTCTYTSTTPLSGVGSLLITNTAANLQGQGCGSTFSIGTGDQGKQLSIDFDYVKSTGELFTLYEAVYVYDVTNAALITPSFYPNLQANDTTAQNHFHATFATATNSTSYRLIIHRSSTAASALTMRVDNIVVKRSPANSPTNLGTVDKYSVACTVGSSALTCTLKGADGNAISAANPVTLSFKNTTAATGTQYVSVIDDYPSGNLSTVISSGSTMGCVSAVPCTLYMYAVSLGGTSNNPTFTALSNGPLLDEGTIQTVSALAGGGSDDAANTLYSAYGAGTSPVKLLARITITEATAGTWASTATEITLPPFRPNGLVGFGAKLSGNKTYSGNGAFQQIAFDSVAAPGFDPQNGFNTGSFRYTIPAGAAGVWHFTGQITTTGTNILANRYILGLYKNGSAAFRGQDGVPAVATAISRSGSWDVPAVVGDYFEIFLYDEGNNSVSTISIVAGTPDTFFSGYWVH